MGSGAGKCRPKERDVVVAMKPGASSIESSSLRRSDQLSSRSGSKTVSFDESQEEVLEYVRDSSESSCDWGMAQEAEELAQPGVVADRIGGDPARPGQRRRRTVGSPDISADLPHFGASGGWLSEVELGANTGPRRRRSQGSISEKFNSDRPPGLMVPPPPGVPPTFGEDPDTTPWHAQIYAMATELPGMRSPEDRFQPTGQGLRRPSDLRRKQQGAKEASSASIRATSATASTTSGRDPIVRKVKPGLLNRQKGCPGVLGLMYKEKA